MMSDIRTLPLTRIVDGDDPAQAAARRAFFHAATGGDVADDVAGRFLARDVMALMGMRNAEQVAQRLGQMRVAATSRARAVAAPVTRRHHARAGDVTEIRRIQPYANFFAVEEYDLTFRRFDGRQSEVVNRTVFISGDAVTVLPYDPVRDRVLVVEQFRPGPYGRDDPQPWQIEAIAGRIDAGEAPEAAARREAVEEAGLTLGGLELVSSFYPSPAAKAEFIYAYVAVTDLPDDAAGIFGVEGEAEDIRGHLLSLSDLMDMVASGEVQNAPLIITALWLQREAARIRASAP